MKAIPGKWEQIQLVEGQVNPSFQCLDKTGKFLYSIHGDFSEISAFSVAEDGTLTYLNTVSTGGTNPVHLSVDRTNRWVFVANLQTGTVAVIPRKEDGSLAELKELYTIPGQRFASASGHAEPRRGLSDRFLPGPQGRFRAGGCVPHPFGGWHPGKDLHGPLP